jgi:hypothetical protein
MLSPESAKDYVGVEDVARWIAQIAVSGTQSIYNLASGRNTTNAEIADALRAAGVPVEFEAGGATIVFPPIDVARVVGEFGPARASLIQQIPELLRNQRR